MQWSFGDPGPRQVHLVCYTGHSNVPQNPLASLDLDTEGAQNLLLEEGRACFCEHEQRLASQRVLAAGRHLTVDN